MNKSFWYLNRSREGTRPAGLGMTSIWLQKLENFTRVQHAPPPEPTMAHTTAFNVLFDFVILSLASLAEFLFPLPSRVFHRRDLQGVSGKTSEPALEVAQVAEAGVGVVGKVGM
jgi:hypothetical protein